MYSKLYKIVLFRQLFPGEGNFYINHYEYNMIIVSLSTLGISNAHINRVRYRAVICSTSHKTLSKIIVKYFLIYIVYNDIGHRYLVQSSIQIVINSHTLNLMPPVYDIYIINKL